MSLHIDFDDEYSKREVLLRSFGPDLEALAKRLLAVDKIQVHRVEHRVKSRVSAADKAARKLSANGEPRPLSTFTDLLGLRIITYFRDTVDDVARLIEREFAIDQENSIDKRAVLDPDQFGYLSLHYVAQLSPGRAALPEYEKYGHVKFEIQVRSVLQHAWAEIEHDLGYKSPGALPRSLRRRFSRLAGLLELADDEFVAMRQEIGEHQSAASETIEQGALGIEIDQDSLSAFVLASDRLRQLSELIARSMNSTVQDRPDAEFMGRQAVQLVALGFHSIADLNGYVDKNHDLLQRFTLDRLGLVEHTPRAGRSRVPAGVALHYVGLLRSAQEMQAGNENIVGHAGIGRESLLLSLRAASGGADPLPGV